MPQGSSMQGRQIEIDRWPSADCRPVAVLHPEPVDLQRGLGIAFRDGRDDLDDLKYAGLKLSSGDQVLLVRHRRAPKPGTEVYADAGVDSVRLVERLLLDTGLSRDDVAWSPSWADELQILTQAVRRAKADGASRLPEKDGPLGELAREVNELIETLSGRSKESHGSEPASRDELASAENLVVEGEVVEPIVIPGELRVARGGSVKAAVEARSIVVEGEIIGDCKAAERIEIRSTGRVFGNLQASRLVIADGGRFEGLTQLSPHTEREGKLAS